MNQPILSFGKKRDSKTVLITGKTDDPKRPKQVDAGEGSDIAFWYNDSNDFPNRIVDQLGKTSSACALLDWKSRALYGGGLTYGKRSLENGKEVFEKLYDPEIEDWLFNTDIQQYARNASVYFYYFANIFPQITLSKDRSRIVYLTCPESVDCRWKLNKAKREIESCLIKDDWYEFGSLEDTVSLPVVPNLSPIEFIKLNKKDSDFIIQVNFTSPGKKYYQRPSWYNLISSGWLEIAQSVTEFKKYILANQTSIKYLVLVPDWWWTWKYPDFENKSQAERQAIVEEEHRRFDEFLTNKENSGKSILFPVLSQKEGYERYAQWEIKPVEDKLKDGTYIEDSQEADAHIFKNFQVDPTLFGNQPGKGGGSAGSGSDKRVAWNIYQLGLKSHQDIVLKPLDLISRFNGWSKKHPGLTWWFENYRVARLDEGSETKSQNTPT